MQDIIKAEVKIRIILIELLKWYDTAVPNPR